MGCRSSSTVIFKSRFNVTLHKVTICMPFFTKELAWLTSDRLERYIRLFIEIAILFDPRDPVENLMGIKGLSAFFEN